MSEIQIFGFEGAQVRLVLGEDGEPWFIASDVARVLGYADADQAVRAHCKAAKTCPVEMTGQVRHVKIIPERDLYRLVLRSRLPAAERFEEWVVGQVLPSIRRTGAYGERDMITALSDPSTLRTLLSSYAERVLALEAEAGELRAAVEVAQPKAEALDRIATSAVGSLCITDAAKALQVGPKALFRWLSTNGWIYRRTGGKNWLAYQNRIQQGVLEHKVTTRYVGLEERVFEQVLVTPKGLAKLAEALAVGDAA